MFFDPKLRRDLVDAIDRQTDQLASIAKSQSKSIELQNDAANSFVRMADAQVSIAETLSKFYVKLFRPQPPGALSAKIREVNNMAFVADCTLPDWSMALLQDNDIEFATIYCNIDGTETTHRVEKNVATFTSPEGPKGATCVLQMTYTDEVPLESVKSDPLELLFGDFQPPAKPNALTATVREV